HGGSESGQVMVNVSTKVSARSVRLTPEAWPASVADQKCCTDKGKLAEGEGFEPPRAWRPLRFSRPLRSTTPASLRASPSLACRATGGASIAVVTAQNCPDILSHCLRGEVAEWPKAPAC